jgi:hypothetical protein
VCLSRECGSLGWCKGVGRESLEMSEEVGWGMWPSREVLANGGLGISRKVCSWGLGFWRGVRVWSLEKCVVWVSREVCGEDLSRGVRRRGVGLSRSVGLLVGVRGWDVGSQEVVGIGVCWPLGIY